MTQPITIVSCSNSREILEQNLLRSPDVVSGALPVRVIKGARSAAAAYAAVIADPPSPVLVFAHQDIYFPAGWASRLREAMQMLDATDPSWAVIGCYGARQDGSQAGYLYDTSSRRLLGRPFGAPQKVAMLDEIVIVVRVAGGVNFDPALPGFHMYATELALAAAHAGRGVYVGDMPVVHNSASVPTLDASFGAAWRFVSRKWRSAMPVPNLMCRFMTGGDWPLWRWRIRNKIMLITGKRILYERVPDPTVYARSSGFE
ncbi:hypothetical protein GCM10007036_18560 [Alsobacter metallidurans]|uniref:Glycosyltransferase n=1 Tax=Alsobacter metallidurans TaxID=340221 RepID=A0A917I770_9HYPH|nr:hypothetical protein [Alsobacter metallidurans]GGH17263.1 hypothetical protein GCM10007036_18560 [Alsobacter metallidurans]